MPDDHERVRRDWRIPDELGERIVPLLPTYTTPLGMPSVLRYGHLCE